MFAYLDNGYSISAHGNKCSLYDPANELLFESDDLPEALAWYRNYMDLPNLDNMYRELDVECKSIQKDITYSYRDLDDVFRLMKAIAALDNKEAPSVTAKYRDIDPNDELTNNGRLSDEYANA